jgi:hypothetical protein
MKAQLPRPDHYSYQLHRKQRTTQIILPIVISAVLFISITILVCVAALNSTGDIARWAEISTIWLTIPMIITALIVLAILIGLIYLMVNALANLPYYTSMAQDYIYIARSYIIRGADMVVKPVINFEGFIEKIKVFFGRIGDL